MPLFGWRKRKEQASQNAAAALASRAAAKSSAATSTAQVTLTELPNNAATANVDGKDLTDIVCQTTDANSSQPPGTFNEKKENVKLFRRKIQVNTICLMCWSESERFA